MEISWIFDLTFRKLELFKEQNEKSMDTQFKLQIHGIIEFDDCMKSNKISIHSFQFLTFARLSNRIGGSSLWVPLKMQ